MKHIFILLLSLVLSYSMIAQVPQTVIVEHFTNTNCGICASRNPAMFALLDNYPEVLHIAYHPSSPYPTCIFSQHNVIENDDRTNFYGIYGGTPRVVLVGEVVPVSSQLLTTNQLTAKLDKLSDYTIHVEQYMMNDSVQVMLVVKRVNGVVAENMEILVSLTENQINYNAPNGESTHYDVFRKELLSTSVNIATGDSLVINQAYSIHPAWQENQLNAIAVLQKTTDKKIVQSAVSGFISNPMGMEPKYQESGMFYPNPANEQIVFTPNAVSTYNRVSVYNVFGKKVLESGLLSPVQTADLSTGYYFLVFENNNDQRLTKKLVVSR